MIYLHMFFLIQFKLLHRLCPCTYICNCMQISRWSFWDFCNCMGGSNICISLSLKVRICTLNALFWYSSSHTIVHIELNSEFLILTIYMKSTLKNCLVSSFCHFHFFGVISVRLTTKVQTKNKQWLPYWEFGGIGFTQWQRSPCNYSCLYYCCW